MYLDEEDGWESHENVDDGDTERDVWSEVGKSLCEDIVTVVQY